MLLQFTVPYGFEDSGAGDTPLLLGFGDDLPGAMAFEATVAFVNPYSAHPEAALDLVEALLDGLPPQTQYMLCPDLSEPLVRPDYEQAKADGERLVVDCRDRLDTAGPKDRQALEAELAALEAEQVEYERTGKWLIPPEKLAWYRAHGERACVAAPGCFEKDATGEAWRLLDQYADGLLPAREFLAAVNQKARMMALEGE